MEIDRLTAASTQTETQLWEFRGLGYRISRPHHFGLVIDGPASGPPQNDTDYLHDHLLAPENREAFFDLIANEGLVVCRNLHTQASSYRKVRGKSSGGKLSQAEYFHHDGCSATGVSGTQDESLSQCPTKPRLVEIRLPFQSVGRNVATAIAPFPHVIRAMLKVFSNLVSVRVGKLRDETSKELMLIAKNSKGTTGELPAVENWDKIQGRINRWVRRELDAEACRAFYREVDQVAGAFDLPWQMGESRLMLNHHADLTKTMQHRRAFQKPRASFEQNGSLVKRWTAEEA